MGTQQERQGQKRLSEKFPIESIRAVSEAERIAREQNSNIGIGVLFTGVFNEMGNLFAVTVLQRNGIDITQFNKNLQLTVSNESVNNIDVHAEPRLTPNARAVIIYGAEHARSKKTQEVLPSDLLVGIARVAEEQVAVVRYFAEHPWRIKGQPYKDIPEDKIINTGSKIDEGLSKEIFKIPKRLDLTPIR